MCAEVAEALVLGPDLVGARGRHDHADFAAARAGKKVGRNVN